MVAAMTSKTGKIGFIGGADAPVIHHFENGFIEGARYVQPTIDIMSEYAGTFDDTQAGAAIADQYIKITLILFIMQLALLVSAPLKRPRKWGFMQRVLISINFLLPKRRLSHPC